ncbi:hypothetical protein IV203_030344 [Nitzschia inconspicua]|uniref:Uncharacterized protein n=1 Tax=Nitzschia inconspicua TaxID=303405 RepID=A0A9K3LSD6_9STRA|nr:hypothetical protein IV203_030344 [Nitzschia inconspicua]
MMVASILVLLLGPSWYCHAVFPPMVGWRHHRSSIPNIHSKQNIPYFATTHLSGGGVGNALGNDSHRNPTTNKGTIKTKTKPFFQKVQSILGWYNNLRKGTVHQPCTMVMQHILYWITAADAVHSLFLNEYSGLYGFLYSSSSALAERMSLVPSVYSKLFYFARLRPRLLYAIGALVRALQLCTPLRKVIDPCIGVGAGVNLCALLAGSRWVQPFVLGWATTKWLWTWLGACQVERAFLPITLSIHEWEDKKKSNKKKVSKLGGNTSSSGGGKGNE